MIKTILPDDASKDVTYYNSVLTKLFNSSPTPQFLWEYEGKRFKLIHVNSAANKITSDLAKNFVGMTANEIYPDRPDILERFNFCLEKRKDIVFETDYIARGTKLHRRIIFTYTYLNEELLLLHTEDITESKDTEKKLTESEQKFRTLVAEMEQGLAVYEAIFNPNGEMTDYRFVDFNKSFEEQTGLKREETIGKTASEVYSGVENQLIADFEKVVKTGKPLHFENYSNELNKYFEIIAYRNQKNQFATVITDITERKTNFKELNLHNSRLEALTKILKYDSNDQKKLLTYTLERAIELTGSEMGFLLFYNHELKKFTLHAWSEGAEKNCGIEDKPKIYELDEAGCWSEAVRQKRPFINNDYSAPDIYKKGTPEGHVRLEKFVTVPIIIDNQIKAVIGVANKQKDYTQNDVKQITVLTDTLWTIVERKEQQKELIVAKERAEESNRLKSTFLANMSHEIRTPMNGILGFAKLLKDPELSSEKRGSYVNIIEKSGKQMLHTIDQLMDISRIESNLAEVTFSEVHVNEQIDSLFSFFLPEAKSIGLDLEQSKALSDDEAIIETDKEKLYAVLMNLIKNALKYTERGSVSFGYESTGDTLIFYVKDTGIGIDKDKIVAVFDRFVQGDHSLSRTVEGVGLGLSIVKAYTDMLGGKIRVESEKNKGSKFFVELPYSNTIAKIDDEEKQEKQEEQPVKNEELLLHDKTVLVAEDDELGRLYLKQLLDGKCKKVFYAENGKKAVDIYAENEGIDLVLMDIKMPVMDGYSATIKIRSMDHNAVIIAQTAYALSGDREKAIAAGCDEYLTKPLAQETLISAIEKYFGKSKTVY